MKLLTANRLSDGAVVWLSETGSWSETSREAAYLDADQAVIALSQAGADFRSVVGAYLIDTDAGGAVVPRERLREAIRANGPTAGHSLRAA
jgi:hypothetical protein